MTAELLIVILTGLVLGSFVTCASWRLPREEDVVRKPSYCPSCKTKLGFRDLWPVLSWVASKGRCRRCKAKIHWRYPLIEAATAAVMVLVYLRFGLSLPGLVMALFAVALLVMIVVDFEHTIIPDQVHIALLPLGVFYHYLAATPVGEVAWGCFAGAAVGAALHYGYRFLRGKEGLGFGDVKFLGVAGLWLGLTYLPPFLFLSGILGTATGVVWRVLGFGERFPFGPALAAALFLCVAYPGIPALFWGTMQSLIP